MTKFSKTRADFGGVLEVLLSSLFPRFWLWQFGIVWLSLNNWIWIWYSTQYKMTGCFFYFRSNSNNQRWGEVNEHANHGHCKPEGGVGKTTACANLGIGLAQAGKKVLLYISGPILRLTRIWGGLGRKEWNDLKKGDTILVLVFVFLLTTLCACGQQSVQIEQQESDVGKSTKSYVTQETETSLPEKQRKLLLLNFTVRKVSDGHIIYAIIRFR